MSKPKYRPVLTQDQISHLISLCKRDMSHPSISCISVLAPYEYKIQNRTVAPSYTQERVELSESLGFAVPMNSLIDDPKSLYEQWLVSPTTLSLQQLESVAEYRYTNDLMTTEEEEKYQNSLIQSSQGA